MDLPPFRNEPLSDFKGNPEHARKMKEALRDVAQELGREYDLVIGGERVSTTEKITSFNPARKSQAVGHFSKATQELADRAIHAAENAFRCWKREPI